MPGKHKPTSDMVAPLRVGLCGLGNVGAAVFGELRRRGDEIAAKAGGPLIVTHVAVRDLDRVRDVDFAGVVCVADAVALAQRDDIDIIIELIGGTSVASEVVFAALAAGKAVVTANKALVAGAADALAASAAASGAPFAYEAAIAGAVPVVRALAVSLAGDRIVRLAGIVNGTCNYILTRMEEAQLSFEDALAEAQRAGYAEADPRSDVEGEDAAFKLALLARLAFDAEIAPDAIAREGISGVRAEDLRRAGEVGLVVRLLAIAERHGDAVDLRVHPTLVPRAHPLAAVRGPMNAVWIEAEAAGPLMLYGQGAGGLPTASAVLGDLVAVARALRAGADTKAKATATATATTVGAGARKITRLVDADDRVASFHIATMVADEPGVLAAVAGAFAHHGVSVESCVQHGRNADPVELVFVTHRCREGALHGALADIAALPTVREVASRLRVLDDGR